MVTQTSNRTGMQAQSSSTTGMQADHMKWQSEHVAWSGESEGWLADCRAALAELARLESEIADHCESIELHRECIAGLQCSCDQHERFIEAGNELAYSDQIDSDFAANHTQQAELHRRQRDLHQNLRGRQRKMMAMLVGLR